jgi:hypothetical protein
VKQPPNAVIAPAPPWPPDLARGILPAFASSLLNLVEAAKKKAKAENKRLGFIMKALMIGCTLWNSHYDHYCFPKRG